jgi:hypothetical protein
MRFLVAWFAFTLAFFSIYLPKRGQYLLPMYPALAMMIAAWVEDMGARLRSGEHPALHRWINIPSLIQALVIALAGLFFLWHRSIFDAAGAALSNIDLVLSERIKDQRDAFEYGAYVLPVWAQVLGSGAALGVAVSAVWMYRRRRPVRLYLLLLATAISALTFFFAAVIPPSFPDDDLLRLSREIGARLQERPGLEVAAFGDDKPYYNIYADFHVHYFDDDEEKDFIAYTARVIEADLPLLILVEKKERSAVRELPGWEEMAQRETSVRGEPIFVYESPPDLRSRSR